MNLTHCKRCGAELQIGPNATNKKFCSTACYTAWWTAQTFTGATQADRLRKQLGAAPKFKLNGRQSAWLACAIDGEGSIAIWRQRLPGNASGFHYRPIVCVYNTDLNFLAQAERLVDNWFHIKVNPTKAHHKRCWTVRVKDRAVPSVLEQIKGDLIVKRKQADLVLEFCRAVAASPVHNRAMHPEFERLYQECKVLNQRGKP